MFYIYYIFFWIFFKRSLLANYTTLRAIIHYCTFGVVLKTLQSVMHRFITGHFYKMNNRAHRVTRNYFNTENFIFFLVERPYGIVAQFKRGIFQSADRGYHCQIFSLLQNVHWICQEFWQCHSYHQHYLCQKCQICSYHGWYSRM